MRLACLAALARLFGDDNNHNNSHNNGKNNGHNNGDAIITAAADNDTLGGDQPTFPLPPPPPPLTFSSSSTTTYILRLLLLHHHHHHLHSSFCLPLPDT